MDTFNTKTGVVLIGSLLCRLDYRKHCIEFLDRIKPDHILWVRYDFWPQMYRVIAERKIPLTLVSGRLHKGHRLLGHTLSKTMRQAITKFFTVDQSSVRLLREVGVAHAECAGDTRFDRCYPSIASNSLDSAFESFAKVKKRFLLQEVPGIKTIKYSPSRGQPD